MLSRQQLDEAVEIQKRSYRLLRWVADAINRGFITFSRVHDYTSAADASLAWIAEHLDNLPPDARPLPGQLRAFSNYFSSFLTTSFDLVDNPGRIRVSPCGCYCPICTYLTRASHLKPKRLAKSDKDTAQRKRIERLHLLAGEEGIPLTTERAERIATGPEFRQAASYSAYGLSLLERIRGSEGGLYVLALWREVAWKPEGSPIKGFTLEVESIVEAEHSLVTELLRP